MFIPAASDKIKKFILPIVLLLFAGLVLVFYTRQNPKIPVAEKPGIKTGLFWMITGNGLQDTSYLYGTTHIICRDSFTLSPRIINAVLHSRVFFNEVLYQDRPSYNPVPYFIKSDTTLRYLIGAGDYKRVQQLIDTTKYPDAVLNRLPPFGVVPLVVAALLGCQTTSYDDELWNIASNARLQLSALETAAEHDAPLRALPLKRQAAMLKRKLATMDKEAKILRQHIEMYAQKKTYYKQDEILLDRRNRKWIPIIEKAIKRQPCFFAFGCSHLFGETGMIRALEEEGYTVTRIDY